MKPWAKWLIGHRMSWVMFAILIGMIPVYLVVGAWLGIKELLNEWVSDWASIKREANEDRRT